MAVAHAEHYAERFTACIGRGVDGVLALLGKESEATSSEEDRSLAQQVLDFALDLESAWPPARQVLLLLAPHMERAGHRDDWRPYLERGVHLSQVQGDPVTEAELQFQLGVLHQRQARFEEAFTAYAESVALCTASGDSQAQARALNRQAYIMVYLQRRPDQARPLLDQAFHLPASEDERAYSYLVQGLLALHEREWEKAVDALETALDLWCTRRDRRMIARTLLTLGTALRRLDRHDEAIHCYRRATVIARELHDPAAEALAAMNWGNVCSTLGHLHEALTHYAAAEPIFHRFQDHLHLAMLSTNQGMVHRKLGNWGEAEKILRLAIARWIHLDNVRSTANALDELGLVYQAQGKFEQAVATFQEALAHLDNIDTGEIDTGEATLQFLHNMVAEHLREAQTDAESDAYSNP